MLEFAAQFSWLRLLHPARKTPLSWFTVFCQQNYSVTFRMHQICFSPRFHFGPRWGNSRSSPRSTSRLGNATFSPHFSARWRLRRFTFSCRKLGPRIQGEI